MLMDKPTETPMTPDAIAELRRLAETAEPPYSLVYKDALKIIDAQERRIAVESEAAVFFRNKAADLQVLRDADQQQIAALQAELVEAVTERDALRARVGE